MAEEKKQEFQVTAGGSVPLFSAEWADVVELDGEFNFIFADFFQVGGGEFNQYIRIGVPRERVRATLVVWITSFLSNHSRHQESTTNGTIAQRTNTSYYRANMIAAGSFDSEVELVFSIVGALQASAAARRKADGDSENIQLTAQPLVAVALSASAFKRAARKIGDALR